MSQSIRRLFLPLIFACALSVSPGVGQPGSGYSLHQILGFPFASDLAAAPAGSRIAWVMMQRGIRNIYVAEGPAFAARRLTPYTEDDGQELTNVSISGDGKYVIYTRGGDHGQNWPGEGGHQPGPASLPTEPHIEVYAVPFAGGAPRLIGRGDSPAASPKGERVAFIADDQIVIASLDRTDSTSHTVYAKGKSGDLQWSPSGDRLAFVSDRGDHSFVGIYTSDHDPILWMDPSSDCDLMPRWSPDGSRIAFVRTPGIGGAPVRLGGAHADEEDLTTAMIPFQIRVADTRSGLGTLVWQSPAGSRGSLPTSNGEANLHWMDGDRLTFLADCDGWAHLYSVPAGGGAPLLLTPGSFMTEFIAASPDHRTLVYAANTGALNDDLERRHIFSVPVDAARPVQLTPGNGIEAEPVVTGDGNTVAFIVGGVEEPMLPAVVPARGGAVTRVYGDSVYGDFPRGQFIPPQTVVFPSTDGVQVHGQFFAGKGAGKHPAIVFIHGGPQRQMLLGWHYMFYYSNSYAVNQYLASQGYDVLAVNYRRGIGYGHEFHHPEHSNMTGASEYQDVLAAGRYLAQRPDVDPKRVGAWGGSYGGYLTAMALGRNSDVFSTGVDIHGVHNFVDDYASSLVKRSRYEQPPDLDEGLKIAWASSPVSTVATWRSPVLFIHGDDDRNVRFHQTVDLIQRLKARGVKYEEMVIPDEVHDFLRHASWLRVDNAVADWFNRAYREPESGAK